MGRGEVALEEDFVVAAFEFRVGYVLGRGEHLKAAVFFRGLDQGELDAYYRDGFEADVGDLAGDAGVAVPVLEGALRAGGIGVVAGDDVAVGTPEAVEEF